MPASVFWAGCVPVGHFPTRNPGHGAGRGESEPVDRDSIKDERDNIQGCMISSQGARPLQRSYEVVFVDDGSADGSFAALRKSRAATRPSRWCDYAAIFGQSAALQAGIDWSVGDVVVTMDGDLQNDQPTSPCFWRS